MAELILASASPRRAELLRQLGLKFRVLAQDVPEQRAAGETAENYVCRVAGDKAKAAARLAGGDVLILGADTEVVCDNEVLGKPLGRQHGIDMLLGLSGREHEVLSAVVLMQGTRTEQCLSRSRVRFRKLSSVEAGAYWDSGEPAGKAGGYAIQGLGAVFIESLQGSYSGVMGLPLFETAALMRRFGWAIQPPA